MQRRRATCVVGDKAVTRGRSQSFLAVALAPGSLSNMAMRLCHKGVCVEGGARARAAAGALYVVLLA